MQTDASPLAAAARRDIAAELASLSTSAAGLTTGEAERRARVYGPNAIAPDGVGVLPVLLAQLENPFLGLLAATAAISLALGQSRDAAIILVIVVLSVALSFVNEFRSRRVVADLRRRLRRSATALRDGRLTVVEAASLVPGDVVALRTGDIVPADLRLIEARDLECDEGTLTGEAMPVAKTASAGAGTDPLDLPSCAFLGTVVRGGSARGVVVATGKATEFGRIAARVGVRLPQTAFQRGLRGVTTLLVRITVAVCVAVFAVNALVRTNVFEALLFALAIAVSLTPQLLPAIVTISLSTGARRMAEKKVLVKRLIAIEDIGNVEVLFTDKTGTLTLGELRFREAVDAEGKPSEAALGLGASCTTLPAGGTAGIIDALDLALRAAAAAAGIDTSHATRRAELPFDHERRLVSVLIDGPDGTRIITKGAPEAVLARCTRVPAAAPATIAARFAAGARVIAVAQRPAPGRTSLSAAEEHDLAFVGLLVFEDPPKIDAAGAIRRLETLGIRLKIVTGDNDAVAVRICGELGIPVEGVLTGAQLATMDDVALAAALRRTTIFARVSPEDKARIIRAQRADDVDVGFLGDGVNDAIALHDADVGISVESAVDVARDAADVVLVTKDLGIVADGVVEGRRIFTNTVKYVLMATSSNLGNMLSTAGASLVLPFLPLLPSQILLNNLLYDASEMTIPSDAVDQEQLRRPAHWDMRLIGRFMLVFGPLSALGDVAMFIALLTFLHADPAMFRAGYFAESFVTQTLVVFAIRTRRVPFFTSRPGAALATTTLAVTAIGAGLTFSPFAPLFGFARLGWTIVPVLAAVTVSYVVLVEAAKTLFFRRLEGSMDIRHDREAEPALR